MSKKEKSIKYFEIKGSYTHKDETVTFTRHIRAVSESDAKESVYTHFGSKHKIRRQIIKFNSVNEISLEEYKEPVGEFLGKTEDVQIIRR